MIRMRMYKENIVDLFNVRIKLKNAYAVRILGINFLNVC